MLTHRSTKFCPGQNKHSIRLQLLQNLGPDLNYFINTDCINFYYSEVSGFDSLLSIFLKKHLFSHWNQDNCIQIFITQNKTLQFIFLFFFFFFGCHGLSVMVLFISLLLSPQWWVRRIYWNCITETLAAGKTLHFKISKYWKWGKNWTWSAHYLAI